MKNARKSICAFIDILGFSEMVLNGDKDGKVKTYLESITHLKSLARASNTFKIITISDSIILNYELNGNTDIDIKGLRTLLLGIAVTQHNLACDGIWTRGGVSCGEMLFTPEESIVVGDAFIKAVSLEKLAGSPRVILDTGIIKLFGFSSIREFILTINRKIDTRDPNQEVIFDYKLHSDRGVDLVRDCPLFVDFGQQIYNLDIRNKHSPLGTITNVCKDITGHNSHYPKYEWLCRYFLAKLEHFKDTYNIGPAVNDSIRMILNTK